MFKQIRPIAFWPAFILLVGALALNWILPDIFISNVTAASDWMLINFGWAFSLTGFLVIIAIVSMYFSKLGEIKIGGTDAKPIMSNFNWFAITLCTTLAAGIVFWGTAEPIYHLAYPPKTLGIQPLSPEAAKFAMETMFLHWTFTPYAIYALPTVLFAISFYNLKKPFSIASQISPITEKITNDKFYQIIDAICLFSLSAGAAAAFGTSTLNIGGALNSITGIQSTPSLWLIISITLASIFIFSASTGVMKGIKILSSLNMKVYYLIVAFVFFVGPTTYCLNLGTEAFGGYLSGFFNKSLYTGGAANEIWPKSWTMFYWAVWMAWAPVTACFLGRISYGRTVKEILNVNFLFPSLFGALWMVIFSGTAINYQLTGKLDLVKVLNEIGPEAVGYAILKEMPFSNIIIPFFFLIVVITAITAFDSTTNAMSALSIKNISIENQEAPTSSKVIWGIIVSSIAFIMLSKTGINGIKTLSNLGGFPAIIIEFLACICVFKMIKNPKKYEFQEKITQQSFQKRRNDKESKNSEVYLSQEGQQI